MFMVPFRTTAPALFGVFCFCLMGLAPLPASAQSGTPELIERLQVRISDLEKLVTDLTGKVEESSYQNKQLSDRLDKLDKEMRFRLNAKESGTQTQSSATTSAASNQTATTLTPPRGAQTGGTATATTTPPRSAVSLPQGSEEEQYNYAFSLLNSRDFAGAEQALNAFITLHPKSRLTGNAQYWLGETYYARGDFEQAALAFMKGYQNYPGSSKGADNLLKLGMSLGKLGKKNEACAAYARIFSLSPPPSEAIKNRASADSNTLGCSR